MGKPAHKLHVMSPSLPRGCPQKGQEVAAFYRNIGNSARPEESPKNKSLQLTCFMVLAVLAQCQGNCGPSEGLGLSCALLFCSSCLYGYLAGLACSWCTSVVAFLAKGIRSILSIWVSCHRGEGELFAGTARMRHPALKGLRKRRLWL